MIEMKKNVILFMMSVVVFSAFIGKEGKTSLRNGRYVADVNASTVKWVGRKIGFSHNGTLDLAEGYLNVHNDVISDGSFKMKMTTIKDESLTDAKDNKKLEGHLKSKDFFYVKKYPQSNFNINTIEHSNGNSYLIKGDLTIKGITHPLEYPANIDIKDNTINVHGEMKFDRTLYDIRFKSGSFFENLGDKLIYDDIEIEVNLVLRAEENL